MFDITELEIGDTAVYHVTDAHGNERFDTTDPENPVPITITIYGPGHEKAVKAEHTRSEKRSTRTVAIMSGKNLKHAEVAANQERAEFLAAITKSFDNFQYAGRTGNDAFRALYLNPKLGHIADGVEKLYNDRGNFVPDSQTS